jgi:anti-anti-sigma factor
MRSRLITTPPAELRRMRRQPYLTRRRVDGSRVVVRLEGEHDVDSAARLARELEEIFASGAGAIVDLSDAEFIDSSILGVLVHAHGLAASSAHARLVVIAPPDSQAARLFDLVGARDFIPTFPSLGAAVGPRGMLNSDGRPG